MPEEPRTTRYRLFRTAWGIRIDLTASAVTTAAPPAHGERVADGVWLDAAPVLTHPPTDGRGNRLSPDEAAWLHHGLSLAAPFLPPDRHTLVTVHHVRFPETDYQPEGLAAALLLWAEQEFELPAHPITVTFDRSANRYVYEGDLTARPGAAPGSSV
ncbi:hypothetical protein [Streptomyces sp. I05A-00742]|uniref:hypothetical protein n=1 Tax=Streptomyces sp. I05A-00742 TaxID=2732853 RepID=UPI001487DC17|nr:hypothetical protein [Streptomyces sp. I05A-00742]